MGSAAWPSGQRASIVCLHTSLRAQARCMGRSHGGGENGAELVKQSIGERRTQRIEYLEQALRKHGHKCILSLQPTRPVQEKQCQYV